MLSPHFLKEQRGLALLKKTDPDLLIPVTFIQLLDKIGKGSNYQS